VTRFDLYTKSEYQVWSTLKAYSATDTIQVMKATISVQKAMEKDDKIGLFVSILKDMFVVGCIYRGWEVPGVFDAFDKIPEAAILMPETKGTQQSLARALSIAGNAKYIDHPTSFLTLIDMMANSFLGVQLALFP
jgi:CDP-glycerol glycerophosphotransferase (TagB/SpsB family)